MSGERIIHWRNDHVSIEWDNPDHTVALIVYAGRWSWRDAFDVYEVLKLMVDSVGHRVHLLIHYTNPHWFPTDHFNGMHYFAKNMHPGIGQVIILGLPKIFSDMIMMVVYAYPKLHMNFAFVHTLEEARALLPLCLSPITAAYSLRWANTEKTIIGLTLHEGWNWDDIDEARQYYGQLVDGVGHTSVVDVIVDTRRHPRLPKGFSPNLEKRHKAMHSRTGVTVFVGLEPLYQDAMKAYYENVPDLDRFMRFAETIEDAESIIAHMKARRSQPPAGVTAAWDNAEQTCIRMVFCGRWEWEQVHETAYRSRRMMDSVTHKVDFIIDLQPPNLMPRHFMAHVGRLFSLMHPRLGIIALVKPRTAGWFKLFCKLNNSLNIQYVITQSVDEAREILEERQARR